MSGSSTVALALGLLVVAGCGGSGAKQAAPTVTGGESCASVGEQTGVRSGPASDATMLLTDVAAARDLCADRVAFDFRPNQGEKPGYRIEYRSAADAQTEDGSGRHVPVEGAAFLVVRFEPAATADLSGDQLEFTYKGPRRIEANGTQFVRQVVKTGDFESVLTWTIGLSERRPFNVITVGSPPSLAVEIR